MVMSAIHVSLLAGILLTQAAGGAADQAPAVGAPQSALAEFLADAKTYVMTIGSGRSQPLELSPQPLLHWANPARNGEDGAVYVWLKDGRPEVIGSVFEYPSRGLVIRKHAFHSLSDEPLKAEFATTLVWSPKTAGVTFQPVAGAPPPADNARRRLSQMRELARQFSVELVDLREGKSELRLMTQPLIRYEPKAGPTQDGAIFAFAIGTDPEALLLLESHQAGDATRWEYAFARFHFVTLTAKHDGKQVWQVEPDRDMMRTVFGNDAQREKIYYSVVKPQ
jgi:hypothetical protein